MGVLVTDVSSFGAWLASARKEAHRPLRQIAAAAGVNASFISDIEHGHKAVPFEVAVRICQHLDYEPFSVLRHFEIVPADILDYLAGAAVSTED